MIDRWFARSKYYGPILSLCVLIFSGYVETQTHTSQLPDTPKKPTPPELRLNGHGMDEVDFAKPKRSTVPAIGVHGGHEILKVLDIQAQNAYFSSDAHTDVPFAFYLPQLPPRANNSLDQFSPANSMHRIPSDEFSLNHPGAIRPVILSHSSSDTAYIQTTPPELGNGISYSPFDPISHVVKRQLSENAVSEIGPFYETNQTKSAEKTRTSENKSAEREHYHHHSKPPQKKKTDLKTTITTIVIISVLVLVFVCGLCYYFPVLHIFSCCKPAPPPTSPRRRPVGIAKKSTEKTDSSLSSKSKKQKTMTKQKQEHFNNALKPTISMPLYELQEHLDCLSDTTSLMSESTTDRLTPRNEATTPVLNVRSSRRADTRVNPTFSNPAGTSPQHLSKRTTTSPTHHLQVETNKEQASHAILVEKGRSVVNENHLKTLPSIIEDYKPPNKTSPRLQAQSPQTNRERRRVSPFAGDTMAQKPAANSPTFSVNHKTSMINNNAAPATSGRPSLVRADSPRSTVASTVNSAQNKLNRENPSVHTTQKPQIPSLRASQLPAHRGLKGNVEATRSPKMAAPRIIVSNDGIEISDL